MFQNKLKQMINDPKNQLALSIFIGFPSTQLAEMAALNKFDVVVIDNEHGMLSNEDVEHMVIAAENRGATPLVRVVSSSSSEILKAMDRGAHGVHVPQVDTREEAEGVVAAVKYPPEGKRGAAFSMRAADYGTIPVYEYLGHANKETFICIHIENTKAIKNIKEILSVKGIDMVYIGPTDLSVSMGYGGHMDHPEVLKAIDKIYQTAREYGVKIGIHTKNVKGAQMRKDWGADYVGLTVTSLVNQSFSDFVTGVKK